MKNLKRRLMKLISKNSMILIFVIGCFLFGGIFLPEEELNEKIKIGVSDDISGFVIDYMLSKKNFNNVEIEENIEEYIIRDC